MVVGLGDQQARDQRADDWRQADRAGHQRRNNHHQQAGGEEQLGALGPGSLGEQSGQGKAPDPQQSNDHQGAQPEGAQEFSQIGAFPAAAHRAEQKNDRHQGDILEQQGA